MGAIDSKWFYGKLDDKGASLRDMARFMALDPSAVSRMLNGERKMSADEQDAIAIYLGVSLLEVAAHRRGEKKGFAEEGQEAFTLEDEEVAVPGDGKQAEVDAPGSFLDRIRDRMKGTVRIAPGTDLTAPVDSEWARVYDDGYPVSL